MLYAVNSDFDLQYNGGTIQSYDLHLIRKHAVLAIANPADPALPTVRPAAPAGSCPSNPPALMTDGSGDRQPLGETCAPPVNSDVYVRDSAIIGAFATTVQLSRDGTRLFVPTRGDTSLFWADVKPDDDPNVAPDEKATADSYPSFKLACGERSGERCAKTHYAGSDPNAPGNVRNLSMPGEPFAMAQSSDGSVVVVTHQASNQVSLFSSGLSSSAPVDPSLKYILAGVPVGGTALAAIPYGDTMSRCSGAASASCDANTSRVAFLETSRSVALMSRLRYYDTDGDFTKPIPPAAAATARPLLVLEASYGIAVNASGADSRDIAIDPTPRLECEKRLSRNPAATSEQKEACSRLPARLFVANRSPASLLVGELGGRVVAGTGEYDPDAISWHASIPLANGPSRLYLAPIVDGAGNYALRLFIVCFDAATIFVYDPAANALESIVRVAPGPFALAFDPFDLTDVAMGEAVPAHEPAIDGLKKYRFAYVASFTNSYAQLLDLDSSRPDKSTFMKVVYTLGKPTPPKGS